MDINKKYVRNVLFLQVKVGACVCVFVRASRKKNSAHGCGRNSECTCIFKFGYLQSFDLVLEEINYHSLNRMSYTYVYIYKKKKDERRRE
jgi:hypothetical protein